MSSPASPAETRAYIIERLVGETGEPDRVVEAARALAERAIPAHAGAAQRDARVAGRRRRSASVELARFADARPQGASNHAMTIAASRLLARRADAARSIPTRIAVVVSALFGGDPDLPASADRARPVADRDHRRRHGLQGGGARRSTARASAPSTCAFRCRRRSPAPSWPSTSCATGPPCASTIRSSPAPSSGLLSLLIPQRVLLKHRGDTVAAKPGDRQAPADWGARFGEEVMRSTVRLRSDDAAVAADARRDRRFPAKARSSRSTRRRSRPRCCRRATRRCSSASSASSGRTTRSASSIRSMPRRNSSMGCCPADRRGRIGDGT